MGRTNARPHLFRNFAIPDDSLDLGRTWGGSASRNIRELLSLVLQDKRPPFDRSRGQIFMGASDPSNTVHTTSAGLAWGDVPPQMPEAGYTLYRYGGTLYNRQYQGSLNYIFRFDTVGFPALFQGRLPAPERRSELRLRHARFFPAGGCGTLLHGVAARALQAAGTSCSRPGST